MNQTNELDVQSAFVGAVIVASSISIIIIQMANLLSGDEIEVQEINPEAIYELFW